MAPLAPLVGLTRLGILWQDRAERGPLLEVRAALCPVDHERDKAYGQAAEPDPEDHRVAGVRRYELAQDPEREHGTHERPDANQQEVHGGGEQYLAVGHNHGEPGQPVVDGDLDADGID